MRRKIILYKPEFYRTVGVLQDTENHDLKETLISVKWQCLGIRNGMVPKYFYIKLFSSHDILKTLSAHDISRPRQTINDFLFHMRDALK